MQARNKLCRLSFVRNTERLLEVRSSRPCDLICYDISGYSFSKLVYWKVVLGCLFVLLPAAIKCFKLCHNVLSKYNLAHHESASSSLVRAVYGS